LTHCLDSDFLIEALRGDPSALRLLRSLEAAGQPCVSAVTAFELTDTTRPRMRAGALAALGALRIVDVDGSAAIAASALSVRLRDDGRPVPMGDLLIAATCLLHDLPLVTRNERHFGRIPRLRLVAW
jgi:hypothetical protein